MWNSGFKILFQSIKSMKMPVDLIPIDLKRNNQYIFLTCILQNIITIVIKTNQVQTLKKKF